jgi:hypothetical protein
LPRLLLLLLLLLVPKLLLFIPMLLVVSLLLSAKPPRGCMAGAVRRGRARGPAHALRLGNGEAADAHAHVAAARVRAELTRFWGLPRRAGRRCRGALPALRLCPV